MRWVCLLVREGLPANLLLGRHLVALLQQLPHLAQLLVCTGQAGRGSSREVSRQLAQLVDRRAAMECG